MADIKVCDFCGEVATPSTCKRVPIIDDSSEQTFKDMCKTCMPKYQAYRRAAEEIVKRYEEAQRAELEALKEDFLNAAKS